jgi:ABC-type transport system involved in multi-copper enzyme maturation permease subunit
MLAEAAMIRLIVEKELKEIIGSTKFAVSFGVCATLIILAFYIGARNHQVSMAQYEAAKSESLRQKEGLTEWTAVRDHRIFLPPRPLASIVTGISNDIGRTVSVHSRGELSAQDSRFNDEPIYAIFRFLDLNFVIQIVLSLFAILFAYDAINGEKEQGTLRLTFSNAIPRDKYILGKIIGTFLGLGVPLLIPIVIGCLILTIMGIPMSGSDWLQLALVVAGGLLYFGIFLTLSVFVSSLTQRTSHSFLLLLVVWIFAVLIIPRSAVLIAGRAVAVPSVDEIASKKTLLQSQLWQEDRKKMNKFQPPKDTEPRDIMTALNKFMGELGDAREKKMLAFAGKLNEERRNAQQRQENLAFMIARLSPTATFSLLASRLAGTSIRLKQHFLQEAVDYQRAYSQFMEEKTGMKMGGNMVFFRVSDQDEEEPEPIDPRELPAFNYADEEALAGGLILDFGILVSFNLILFLGAFVGFLRYDVR